MSNCIDVVENKERGHLYFLEYIYYRFSFQYFEW